MLVMRRFRQSELSLRRPFWRGSEARCSLLVGLFKFPFSSGLCIAANRIDRLLVFARGERKIGVVDDKTCGNRVVRSWQDLGVDSDQVSAAGLNAQQRIGRLNPFSVCAV